MIIEDLEKLKQVRRDLKEMGYKIKTHQNSLGRFGDIVDSSTNEEIFIISDLEHYNKHKKVFMYMEKLKNSKGAYVI